MATLNKSTLLAASAFITMLAYLPLGEGEQDVSAPVSAPAFQARHSDLLDEAVTVDRLFSISPMFMDPETGGYVRVIAMTTICHGRQVMLSQGHLMLPVSVSSDSPIEDDHGPFNTGLSQLLAAEALGGSDEGLAATYLANGQQVPAYLLTVAPAPGLVWGSVTSPDDVVFTEEPAPER